MIMYTTPIKSCQGVGGRSATSMKVTQLPVIDSSSSSRERMMQAAKHLFAGEGFDKATTIEIVRLAGTSDSPLTKHFGGKESLPGGIFPEARTRNCGRPALPASRPAPCE